MANDDRGFVELPDQPVVVIDYLADAKVFDARRITPQLVDVVHARPALRDDLISLSGVAVDPPLPAEGCHEQSADENDRARFLHVPLLCPEGHVIGRKLGATMAFGLPSND